jgi:hypothetical protein
MKAATKLTFYLEQLIDKAEAWRDVSQKVVANLRNRNLDRFFVSVQVRQSVTDQYMDLLSRLHSHAEEKLELEFNCEKILAELLELSENRSGNHKVKLLIDKLKVIFDELRVLDKEIHKEAESLPEELKEDLLQTQKKKQMLNAYNRNKTGDLGVYSKFSKKVK